MRGLKRKLTACAEEENRILQHTQSRIKHIGELYSMQSVDDVKYEAWSRTRLDRLLVDYLLRHCYKQSAIALARAKGIEELEDMDPFVQMSRIRESLRVGKVTEALAWCTENKKELRRTGVSEKHHLENPLINFVWQSKLEFTLRFQQYIELIRTQDKQKILDAIAHAKKFMVPFKDTYPKEVQQAAGLLAFPPGGRTCVYEVGEPFGALILFCWAALILA